MSPLWFKAEAAAEAARLLFRSGDYDGACNRAYYAVFNSARALLEMRGVSVANFSQHATVCQHATVWRQFSLHLVKDGSFGRMRSRALARVGEIRHAADYSHKPVTSKAAQAPLEEMEGS